MKKYVVIIIAVLFVFLMPFVFTNISENYKEPFNIIENPLPWIVLLVFIGILALLVWLVIEALQKVQQLEDEKNGVVAESLQNQATLKIWIQGILRAWTKAKPVAQEGEIILDHDYDGIKELDNSLPPWWIYMFFSSI